MNTLDVGIIQLDTKWENPEENQKKIEEILSQNKCKLDLVVLPEMFLTGFSCENVDISQENSQKSLNWIKEFARSQKIHFMGSLKFRDQNNLIRNRLFLVAPDGETQHYDKRHLFPLSAERENLKAGDEINVFHLSNWKILPQICYDLRFPVWARNTTNYDVLINVANWPTTRRDAWKTLIRARAIENQAYSVGVNRIGRDAAGLTYTGDSIIIDPLGNEILQCGNIEGLFKVTLEKNSISEIRSTFPFLKDMDNFTLKVTHE
ncbi:nitrilase-related carbon-nitrogen hydrolase [Bdellovibrio sp. HCB-110]|uniref:nitrilase-related carbon-nitrogen hydrolase n=1 Tax=Bdellovibrio sp. HCB-110 TaxID=3391182 RepID=UPI0039B4CE81